MVKVRFLHPPRTSGSSIKRAWHLKPPEYIGHRAPEPAEFSYGVTRNPWDRVVSLFHLFNGRIEHFPDFREWILSGMPCPPEFMYYKPRQSIPHPTVDLREPCWFWLKDADFVVRYETRVEDLRKLALLLGRPDPSETNVGGHGPLRKPYQEYYDEKTRLWVAARYSQDIEVYGYEFEE